MNRKKRILFLSEASYTKSGFGIYANEVLKRLAQTGKYELAELASFGHINHPNDVNSNWLIYPNAVPDNDPRAATYKSHPTNIFGAWRFDKVCLDFQPDVVFGYRDPWMLLWENYSPLRRFYHQVWMPTVDSGPVQDAWIDAYTRCDGVFGYTEYGLKQLNKQSNNKIKTIGLASPGINLSIFSPPINKKQQKAKCGFNPEINLIGTVMRNQPRKLYPDLFEAFSIFLNKCLLSSDEKEKELGKNTYLMIHTSYPDNGWNIPQLLKKYGISHRVYFSYYCRKCGQWFPSLFEDALTNCPNCHTNSAILPNVSYGISEEQLAEIYKCLDVYVQYANCEGFGMSMPEALACGVPIMATNYSAMEDLVKNSHGFPLEPLKMSWDFGVQAQRAIPDNENTANQLLQFFSLPFHERQKRSFEARLSAEKHYNWDNTAKILENYFDGINAEGSQGKWDSEPPLLYSIPQNIPNGLSNEQFVDFIFYHVIRKPELRNSYTGIKMITDLNLGAVIDGNSHQAINREMIFNNYKSMAENALIIEKLRCGILQSSYKDEDFIKYARMKQRSLEMN